MPAINLAKLKIQAAQLAEEFGEPEKCVRDLNKLLDSYNNPIRRSKQMGQLQSVIRPWIPKPVIRQIENEMGFFVETQPTKAIDLAKALWKDGSLESRHLAAFLIGNLPSAHADEIIKILPGWLNQTTDKEIWKVILSGAMIHMRNEKPDFFLSQMEGWLKSQQVNQQLWGLQALIPLLTDPNFENLPAVFRMLRPVLLSANPALQLDLQACLVALEKVSFTETVTFLRELLSNEPKLTTLLLLRRIMPGLSNEIQETLRESLRTADKASSQVIE
jgi:hypothetical protein